jgi:hypothetical protein
LKLGHLFGKTAISKSLKGISVGKFKFPAGHKGQYSFGGKEVLFFLPSEYVTHSCLAGFHL